eukprot:TRINITY_DN313_c0_g1_i1.p1 TRINITY_DN313_c0_g1~~TRINITY_DN313_c0_g1_i1.p1  ORF type:complete len:1033 (-),score=371.42 TRINITY_DN313_c0_g1_i1:85-3183(-)
MDAHLRNSSVSPPHKTRRELNNLSKSTGDLYNEDSYENDKDSTADEKEFGGKTFHFSPLNSVDSELNSSIDIEDHSFLLRNAVNEVESDPENVKKSKDDLKSSRFPVQKSGRKNLYKEKIDGNSAEISLESQLELHRKKIVEQERLIRALLSKVEEESVVTNEEQKNSEAYPFSILKQSNRHHWDSPKLETSSSSDENSLYKSQNQSAVSELQIDLEKGKVKESEGSYEEETAYKKGDGSYEADDGNSYKVDTFGYIDGSNIDRASYIDIVNDLYGLDLDKEKDNSHKLPTPSRELPNGLGDDQKKKSSLKREEMTVKEKLNYGYYSEYFSSHEQVSSNGHRDWNEEYQILYESLVKSLQGRGDGLVDLFEGRGEEDLLPLNRVAQEFADTATLYSKIIISEFCLPPERKTIKPIDIGGIAGGLKYRVQNIMFKFAFDSKIDENLWMYGGKSGPNYSAAFRAAKNEMKGLEAHSSCYVEGLCYPMMAVVDYKGFRMLAMPVLPIGKDTIRYGSDDAGVTVHASDPILNGKMRLAGKRLNLRGHITGVSGNEEKRIYGPGDIEGHLGTDGRYYVLDFGRLMPPEDPSYRKNNNSRAVFSELLRPELVLAQPKPMCSDALTSWNSDPDQSVKNEINNQIRAATKDLYQNIISAFAKHLDGMPFDYDAQLWKANLSNWGMIADFIGNSAIHQSGLCVRHMGLIRNASKNYNMRRVLMSTVISRIARHDLREVMRSTMKEVRAPSDEPFKVVVVKYLNQLLGVSKSSKRYWNDIKLKLEGKYSIDFTEDIKQNPELDLKELCDLRVVLLATLQATGIEIDHNVNTILIHPENHKSLRFVEADIKRIESVTKHRSDIYFTGGMIYLSKVKTMARKGKRKDEIMRQVYLAIIGAKSAFNANPSSPLYPTAVAAAMFEKANRLDTYEEILYKKIYLLLERTLMAWPGFPISLKIYSEALRFHASIMKSRGREDKEKMLIDIALEKEEELKRKTEDWKKMLKSNLDESKINISEKAFKERMNELMNCSSLFDHPKSNNNK